MAAKKKNARNATIAFQSVPETELGKLVTIPLTDIDTSYENARTGNWQEGDPNSVHEGNSFLELLESIRETGQKDPVTVRPKGKKYQLIKGFRRFAALKKLATDSSTMKTATIKAIVKDLNDLQAFEEHVLENTARDNLSGPDLAFAAYNLGEKYRLAGTPISGNIIAQRMGKNQSYISALLRIVGSAPKVAKMWRDAPIQLSINEMTRIAKIKDPAVQEQEYARLLDNSTPEDGQAGSGGKDWVKSAAEKAAKVATLIGTLEREGYVGKVDITWDDPHALLALGVKVKADATGRQRQTIGKQAREAYAAAKNAVVTTPAEAPAGK